MLADNFNQDLRQLMILFRNVKEKYFRMLNQGRRNDFTSTFEDLFELMKKMWLEPMQPIIKNGYNKVTGSQILQVLDKTPRSLSGICSFPFPLSNVYHEAVIAKSTINFQNLMNIWFGLIFEEGIFDLMKLFGKKGGDWSFLDDDWRCGMIFLSSWIDHINFINPKFIIPKEIANDTFLIPQIYNNGCNVSMCHKIKSKDFSQYSSFLVIRTSQIIVAFPFVTRFVYVNNRDIIFNEFNLLNESDLVDGINYKFKILTGTLEFEDCNHPEKKRTYSKNDVVVIDKDDINNIEFIISQDFKAIGGGATQINHHWFL